MSPFQMEYIIDSLGQRDETITAARVIGDLVINLAARFCRIDGLCPSPPPPPPKKKSKNRRICLVA